MAARLGVSSKALRVYEREGLVTPGRSAAGWRAYGPAQAARLHQIMALRGLGLSLKQIRALLVDDQASLADILVLQRDSLAAQRGKLDAAITAAHGRSGSSARFQQPTTCWAGHAGDGRPDQASASAAGALAYP